MRGSIWICLMVLAQLLDGSLSSAEDAPFTVGVIAPLTGAASEVGTQIRNGLELAREDLGNKAAFVYQDEACDAKTAVTAAQNLLFAGDVSVIIGPLCSPSFLAVAPILNKSKIVFVHSSSGTQNTSSRKGDFGIEGTGTVMEENKFLAKHMRSIGLRRAAVIHFEQEWAVGHARAFVDAFTSDGGTIAADEVFTNVSESDYRPLILKIKAAALEAIFIAAFNGQTATILKQIRALGITLPVFAQYDIEDLFFLEAAGAAAEGVTYTYPFDNVNLSPQTAAFKQRYLARYGKEPSFYPYNGYDIAMLVSRALEKCGKDAACTRNEIVSTRDYQGLAGKISYAPDGNISREFLIKKVEQGKFIKEEQERKR